MVRTLAKFKMIVSDPQTGKATVTELEGSRAQVLVGRKIGEVLDGSQIGVVAGKLRITGGCDKDGVPMRADVHGGAKKHVILSSGVGFRPKRPGERRRKLVRGSMITEETYQVNTMLFMGEEKPVETPTAEEPRPIPSPAPKAQVRIKKTKPVKKPAKKAPKKRR